MSNLSTEYYKLFMDSRLRGKDKNKLKIEKVPASPDDLILRGGLPVAVRYF